MEKKPLLKKTKVILIISLALVLLGSVFANIFNTSFYSVNVSDLEIETEHGMISALLYMPKGAGENDKRPVIITTHGYLNSKENQDSAAIEMSRRGYIVLDIDMYDHGDSRWDEVMEYGNWLNWYNPFWTYSLYDVSKYVYDQPYTLKDSEGNAYVAVSGHSMGGFCSQIAMYLDEMDSLTTGYRRIYTAISAGADFSYSSMIGTQEQLQAAFGSRTVGMICAHYDEFFFNKSNAEKTEEELAMPCTLLTLDTVGTVSYKDYISTLSGKQFLGLSKAETGELGRIYDVTGAQLLDAEGNVLRDAETGGRVIYEPYEIHPFNYFSLVSIGYEIEFYNTVFAEVITPTMAGASLGGTQIWYFKEIFNLVAMIGFFMLFIPLAELLLKIPVFAGAVSEERKPLGKKGSKAGEQAFWLVTAGLTAVTVLLYVPLMDRSEPTMSILKHVFSALGSLGVIAALVGAIAAGKRKEDPERAGKSRDLSRCGICVAVLSACEVVLTLPGVYWYFLQLDSWFKQPQTNCVSFWALVSGLMIAITVVIFYYFVKKPNGAEFADYGIIFKLKPILSALGIAIILTAAGYAILFAVRELLGVDFRFWGLMAMRMFNGRQLIQALRYMPFFFIYYLASAVSLRANINGRKCAGLLAIIVNVGGLFAWLIIQYGLLFATGKGGFTGSALNSCVLLGIVCGLALAQVFALKLTKLTNNIWLASFFNTLLFVIASAANTATFWMYG